MVRKKREVRKPPKFDIFLNPDKKEEQINLEKVLTEKIRYEYMSEIFFLSVIWIRIRTNLHYGRPPGSGSVWRMLIRIQELKSRQKMCQKVLKT